MDRNAEELPPIEVLPKKREPWNEAAIKQWLVADVSAFDTVWIMGLVTTLGALAAIALRSCL